VNGLRQKENHGQETQQAKAQRQWPRHLLKNITHAPVNGHASASGEFRVHQALAWAGNWQAQG
jgi:hypothetical protein